MRNPLSRPLRALENFNFRLWTAGGLVSNIGTWMQRVAQDWIVLTQLTRHDATAVGSGPFQPGWVSTTDGSLSQKPFLCLLTRREST
jgi:hypothetical protein